MRRITDLTDLSRLDAGRLPLELAPMDLVELAHACAEQAQGEGSRHRIRVDVPDGPIVGIWDRDCLGQVLSNLLSDAVKYAPDGGDIILSVESWDREACVSVRDHGLGIAADELPKLFDRFYRTETSASHAVGLGLGLHIRMELVEAHGGRVWA